MCNLVVGPLCGLDRDGWWMWAVVAACSSGEGLEVRHLDEGGHRSCSGGRIWQWPDGKTIDEGTGQYRLFVIKQHLGCEVSKSTLQSLTVELKCKNDPRGRVLGTLEVGRLLRGLERKTVSCLVVSCSEVEKGLVRRRLACLGDYQCMLHLGDMVYGVETITRAELVNKYISTWQSGVAEWGRGAVVIQQVDDHELANNYWPGVWDDEVRRRTEIWEWMTPSRVGASSDLKPLGVGRYVAFSLPNARWRVVMVDSRSQRARQPGTGAFPHELLPQRELARPRQLLGSEQWVWLEREIERARRAGEWVLFVQQVVIGPLVYTRRKGSAGWYLGVNADQWDGYQAERERLVQLLARLDGKVVCVSGDWHVGLIGNVMHGEEKVGGEVVVPALGAGCWWWEAVARAVEGSDTWEWVGPNTRGAWKIELSEGGCEVEMITAGCCGPRWRWDGSRWIRVRGRGVLSGR